jgi:hypothetical protein
MTDTQTDLAGTERRGPDCPATRSVTITHTIGPGVLLDVSIVLITAWEKNPEDSKWAREIQATIAKAAFDILGKETGRNANVETE